MYELTAAESLRGSCGLVEMGFILVSRALT